MAAGDSFQGRRVPAETAAHDLRPGEYALKPCSMYFQQVGGIHYAWWVRTPNGLLGRLSMPEDVKYGRQSSCHIVEIHDDGQITVRPQPTPPTGQNSILVRGYVPGTEGLASWHGYIEHGVWRACE